MGTQEIPNSPASDQIIGNSTIGNSTIGNSTTVNLTTVNSTIVNLTTMRSEAQRLSTFTSWPHNDKVEARKIAKAGFFHTGIGKAKLNLLKREYFSLLTFFYISNF